MDLQIDQIEEDLYLIDLAPPIAGLEKFIGTWVYTGKPTFIVDVGPSVTSDNLIKCLTHLGVNDLDYILLTHIHLDHAGAIGDIAKFFPNTPIICHKSGIPHLVDPSLLWKMSLKVLGDMANTFGPMKQVPFEQLMDVEQFREDMITPICTPGHAPHHVSFLMGKYLFAGEICGVRLMLPTGELYHHPATPPKFFLETALHSIDIVVEKKPQKICFSHFGMSDNAVTILKEHKEQLILWKNIIKEEMTNPEKDSFFSRCIDRLIHEDPRMAAFYHLDEFLQEWERELLINSIQGFEGYLKQN